MTEIEKIRQAIKDAVSGNWKEDYDLASKAIEQYVIKAKMEMILKYLSLRKYDAVSMGNTMAEDFQELKKELNKGED